MKKSKPDFRSYFRGVAKNKDVITDRDGRTYKKKDIVPRIVILVGILIGFFSSLLISLLIDSGDTLAKIIITIICGIVLIIAYIPLVYLFTKFEEVNEDKEGIAKIMSESNAEKRDS
ncbi:MAG: hypothetical protein HN389_05685 [Clostridia bacterium]|jgi:hypothetical protein|nr:hypothetical protein [Clostridia bacterium]